MRHRNEPSDGSSEDAGMTILTDVTFEVASVPKGQPRARARSFGGRILGVYTPETARSFKEAVGLAALNTPLRDRMPIRNACSIHVVCYMPRPKRLCTKATRGRRNVPHLAKPDKDNLEKAVLDALVNVGILHDDSLVFDGGLRKLYADMDDAPHALVRLIEYGEDDNG